MPIPQKIIADFAPAKVRATAHRRLAQTRTRLRKHSPTACRSASSVKSTASQPTNTFVISSMIPGTYVAISEGKLCAVRRSSQSCADHVHGNLLAKSPRTPASWCSGTYAKKPCRHGIEFHLLRCAAAYLRGAVACFQFQEYVEKGRNPLLHGTTQADVTCGLSTIITYWAAH